MKENFGIKSDEDITIKQYIDENVKNKEGENIKEDKHITLSFNNKVIVDKILDAPETFKITIDENNKIKNVEYIEFSDLK